MALNLAEKIMVALDFDELDQAKNVVDEIGGYGVTFKVGNQLGTYEGWSKVIDFIHNSGAKIFCDTKFKDIPETVKKSSRAITRHSPDFFNIMADNSRSALGASIEGVDWAVEEFGLIRPTILGVTVLTTIDEEACMSIYGGSTEEKVQQFSESAALAGLDGVVCSAREAGMLRLAHSTKELVLVTPGIRPKWAATDDQKRITTPADALTAGVDYLVIGRPITKPPKRIGTAKKAIELIIEEMETVL